MKRVLQVVGSLRIGGLESMAMNFARYANPNEYKFDYLIYGDDIGEYEEEAIRYGCRIIRIAGPQSGYRNFCSDLRAVIQKYGPYDIVHSHTYFNSGLVVRIAKKNGVKKCISHAHSGNRNGNNKIKRRIAYFVLRKLLNKYSDAFCACTSVAGKYVFGEKHFLARGVVLPNIINLDKFAYSKENDNCIREEFNIKNDKVVIGTVGHMLPVKNQLFLIDVFKEYIKNHDAILLIVGDGPLREQIEAKVLSCGLKDKVVLTGVRKDVDKIMSCMNVFVLTSLHEGLPLTIVEATANGLSFVIEKDVVTHEMSKYDNCKTVKGYDVRDWCVAISAAVSQGRYDSYECIKQLDQHSPEYLKKMIHKLYS